MLGHVDELECCPCCVDGSIDDARGVANKGEHSPDWMEVIF